MEIRIAEDFDAIALNKLYLELTDDVNVSVDSSHLQQLRENKTNRIYVAEFNGEVVGTIFVTICLDPMYGDQPFAVFENFIVTTGYRGQGLGKLLS